MLFLSESKGRGQGRGSHRLSAGPGQPFLSHAGNFFRADSFFAFFFPLNSSRNAEFNVKCAETLRKIPPRKCKGVRVSFSKEGFKKPQRDLRRESTEIKTLVPLVP